MDKFMKLLEAIKAYPFSKSFKIGEVFPGWSELTDEEKNNLKRQLVAFTQDNYDIRIEDDEEDHLGDLDFSYTKSLYDDIENENFDDAVKTAISLKSLEQGRKFILPEIEREQENMYGPSLRSDLDTENALNKIIKQGFIPFLKIVGKEFGFTVYEKL